MARVPTGNPRGRPKGLAKTGGRVAGKSLDKGQRQLVNAQMAGDILAVYERLGGVDFLYRWAKANQTAYVANVLQKLLPAAPKDDPDIQINQQINIDKMSEVEAARRVAFALSKAIFENSAVPPQVRDETVEWIPPVHAPEPASYQPVEDAGRARWASEIPLSPQERADNVLIRETRTATIENYHGSSSEQGGYGPVQRTSASKPTAAELCRRLSRRGRDLI